jgi:hypothetical protein
MNLREKLKEILPDILPEDPTDAIKGTKLIELVRVKLKQHYSDATLRYHFSIMCCDPSMPIAKVNQGQGYYLRSPMNSPQGAQNLISFTQGMLLGHEATEAQEIQLSRAMKFRALYARMNEAAARFPFLFDQDAALLDSPQALWHVPTLALVEWAAHEVSDEGELRLDSRMLRLKQMMGMSPFTITSVKLRLDADLETLRSDFFQCLSQSGWAHQGELVFAGRVEDERAADTLRSLASRYGIAVTSFGINLEQMDEWQDAAQIMKMGDREFESLTLATRIQRIAPAKPAPYLDWQALEETAQEHSGFTALFEWIEDCIANKTAHAVPCPGRAVAKKASGQ